MTEFSCAAAFDEISRHQKRWMLENGIPDDAKWIVEIDEKPCTAIVAAIEAKIHGQENVVGAILPCDDEPILDRAMDTASFLNIRTVHHNIGDAAENLAIGVENCGIDVARESRKCISGRLKIAALYAFAQSLGGVVVSSTNKTNLVSGQILPFDGNCGDYSPLKDITSSEAIELGKWLGLPNSLLCFERETDVREIDRFIRNGTGSDKLKSSLLATFHRNRRVISMLNVPGPKFGLPDHVEWTYNLTTFKNFV